VSRYFVSVSHAVEEYAASKHEVFIQWDHGTASPTFLGESSADSGVRTAVNATDTSNPQSRFTVS
jgi:hypothetical protein